MHKTTHGVFKKLFKILIINSTRQASCERNNTIFTDCSDGIWRNGCKLLFCFTRSFAYGFAFAVSHTLACVLSILLYFFLRSFAHSGATRVPSRTVKNVRVKAANTLSH